MGTPDWATDPVFATVAARNEVAEGLAALVESFTEEHTVEYLWHEGQRRRIAFAPVFTMADLSRQVHLRKRGFFASIDQPGLGTIEVPGPPCLITEPLDADDGVARWSLRRRGTRTGPG